MELTKEHLARIKNCLPVERGNADNQPSPVST